MFFKRPAAVFHTSYYSGLVFDRWLISPGFYLYGPGPFVWVFAFRQIGWLYFVILCFISVVIGSTIVLEGLV